MLPGHLYILFEEIFYFSLIPIFLLDCLNFFDAELYELFVYFRN